MRKIILSFIDFICNCKTKRVIDLKRVMCWKRDKTLWFEMVERGLVVPPLGEDAVLSNEASLPAVPSDDKSPRHSRKVTQDFFFFAKWHPVFSQVVFSRVYSAACEVLPPCVKSVLYVIVQPWLSVSNHPGPETRKSGDQEKEKGVHASKRIRRLRRAARALPTLAGNVIAVSPGFFIWQRKERAACLCADGGQ